MGLGYVAIPQGSIYPDGLNITTPDPVVQATVRPEGSFFTKSAGYETIRPGRSIFQHNKGQGIHFTPLEFAENLGEPATLPALVTIATAADHVETGNIPGSQNLTIDGQASEQERVLLGESTAAAAVGSNVQHRGRLTLPDMGDREPNRPLSAVFHGLENPVEAFRAEYKKSPLIAVGAGALIVGLAYMVARDFERSYRSSRKRESAGGGVVSEAAPVVAVAPAAAHTGGGVIEQVADTVASGVELIADGAAAVIEDAAAAVAGVADAAGDAVEGGN